MLAWILSGYWGKVLFEQPKAFCSFQFGASIKNGWEIQPFSLTLLLMLLPKLVLHPRFQAAGTIV